MHPPSRERRHKPAQARWSRATPDNAKGWGSCMKVVADGWLIAQDDPHRLNATSCSEADNFEGDGDYQAMAPLLTASRWVS